MITVPRLGTVIIKIYYSLINVCSSNSSGDRHEEGMPTEDEVVKK